MDGFTASPGQLVRPPQAEPKNDPKNKLQALNDGDVSLPTPLTHGLQTIPPTRALQLMQQGRHQLGTRRAQRMAEGVSVTTNRVVMRGLLRAR